jgi:hypothetical protein
MRPFGRSVPLTPSEQPLTLRHSHKVAIDTMAYRFAVALLIALLAACETEFDPQTGETQTRLTLPSTQANAAAQQERWRRCVAFRSESFCERNVSGGRPPGASGGLWGDENDYPEYSRRDP